LIDLVALGYSMPLNKKLCEVFQNDKSVIIGFSFQSDIQSFQKNLKHFTFYKNIAKFIDL